MMRKLRLVFVAAVAAGSLGVFAGPAEADVPCKIVIHQKYIANNPACLILP